MFRIVKLILFAGVIFLLYYQVNSYEISEVHISVSNWTAIIVATLLVYPNIYCVYLIWKQSLVRSGIAFTGKQLNHSFFAGIVTGLLTPNMVGNFIGRVYYFDSKDRTVLTGLTLYGNHAHFVTSLLFGAVSLLFVDKSIWESYFILLKWPLLFVILIGVLIYFFPEKIIPASWTKWQINELRSVLVSNKNLALLFLGYTGIRFLIFSTQFFLVLVAFGVAADLKLYISIWLIYFITLSAPSLFLGKLGIKESISIFVLSTLGIDPLIVLVASLYIWLLNTFSPALLGLFITRERTSG